MATIHNVLSRGMAKTAAEKNQGILKVAALYKEAARRFLDDSQLDTLVKASKEKKRKGC